MGFRRPTIAEKVGEILVSFTRQERRCMRKVAGPGRQSARYQRIHIKAFRRYEAARKRQEA